MNVQTPRIKRKNTVKSTISMVFFHSLMPTAWLLLGGLVIAPHFIQTYYNIPAELPKISMWVLRRASYIHRETMFFITAFAIILAVDAGVYYLLAKRPRKVYATLWSAAITTTQAAFTIFCVTALYIPMHIATDLPGMCPLHSH